MVRKLRLGAVAAALVTACGGTAIAQNALLVTGQSTTAEPDTTRDATQEIQTLLAQLNVPFTTADAISGLSIDSFSCVLDIRFSDAPMEPADQAAYAAHLQAGRGLLLLGENASFPTRNDSIVAFANGLGAGGAAWAGNSSDGQVCASAELCNGVAATITYFTPGEFTAAGSGDFVTGIAGDSAAVVWGLGDLSGAAGGRLIEMLTINWIESDRVTPANEQLMRNMISFLCGQHAAAAPALSPQAWGLTAVLLAGGGAVAIRRRRKAGRDACPTERK